MQSAAATELEQENPLTAGLERVPVRDTALVIFGATGDLAHRKLLPALYNLARYEGYTWGVPHYPQTAHPTLNTKSGAPKIVQDFVTRATGPPAIPLLCTRSMVNVNFDSMVPQSAGSGLYFAF